jgi:hypothetical protein
MKTTPVTTLPSSTFKPLHFPTKDYHLVINQDVYDKVMWWVNRSPVEVSGFGRVEFIDGIPTVTSAYLVEQENTASDTEIDDVAIGKLEFESREDAGHLNWWWHSHVNMGVFWSGTDYEAIHQIGKNGWVIATVFNKKEETKTALYQGGSKFFPPVFLNDIKTMIQTAEHPLADQWEKEYTEKCKRKTYPTTTPSAYTGYDFYKGKRFNHATGKWEKAQTTPTHPYMEQDWEDYDESFFNRQTNLPLDDTPPVRDLNRKEMDEELAHLMRTAMPDYTTPLPEKWHPSDGKLVVMAMDEMDQQVLASYYKLMYDEDAEEWYDLEIFYEDFKLTLDTELMGNYKLITEDK